MPDTDTIDVPVSIEEDHPPLEEGDTSLLGPSDPNLTATPRSKEPFSVLTRIPLDVLEFREKVFRLDEPFTFSAQQWEKYWP